MPKVDLPASSPPPSDDPWEVTKRWIDISFLDGDKKPCIRSVEATCYGRLAIHRSLGDTKRGKQIVTAVNVGRAVARVNYVDDAVKIVRYLRQHCYKAFLETTRDAIHAKIPSDIVQWLINCTTEQKYLEPPVRE